MKIRQLYKNWVQFWFLCCIIFVICASTHAQKKSKYKCEELQPESMCNANNTCGLDSSPCTVDITRSGSSSNVKPSTPTASKNELFCIKSGTTVVWKSSKKNTGFLVSFGSDSPFEPDGPITGGGKKQVTTKAVTPGCYKFDAGAFISGTVYGMSGGNKAELVILP